MTRSCSVWNLIIYSNACTCGGIFSRNCLKADTWTELKTCFLSYLSEEWILLDTLELLRACILYSQTIFSQKNKKPQHQAGFRMQVCLVSCQHYIQAQASYPGWECEQEELWPSSPTALLWLPFLPPELHKQVHELPMSMTGTCWRQTQPAHIHFSPCASL